MTFLLSFEVIIISKSQVTLFQLSAIVISVVKLLISYKFNNFIFLLLVLIEDAAIVARVS